MKKKASEITKEMGFASVSDLREYIDKCIAEGRRKEAKNLLARVKDPENLKR